MDQFNCLTDDNIQGVNSNTEIEASLDPNFLIKYGFVENINDLKQFNINSFKQIGFPDPFYNTDYLKQAVDDSSLVKFFSETTDLVYPDKWYKLENSPLCIYIPRKELMFKIMRGCIGVTKENELWFNQAQIL